MAYRVDGSHASGYTSSPDAVPPGIALPREEEDEVTFDTVLCTPFCFTSLACLTLHELGQLQTCDRHTRSLLSSNAASEIWSTSACGVWRCMPKRLGLPQQVLNEIPVLLMKRTLKQMARAQGQTNCPKPAPLADNNELQAVVRCCARCNKQEADNALIDRGADSCPASVIVGRMYFDEESLERMLEFPGADGHLDLDDDDDDDDDGSGNSNEIGFWWPNSGPGGTMLLASLSLRRGSGGLEVSSVIKPSSGTHSTTMSLQVDMHLLNSEWQNSIIVKDMEVNVDGRCIYRATPTLDVSDDRVRKVLAGKDGVLCILVVHGPWPSTVIVSNAQPGPWQVASSVIRRQIGNGGPLPTGATTGRAIENSSHHSDLLNALALSLPTHMEA